MAERAPADRARAERQLPSRLSLLPPWPGGPSPSAPPDAPPTDAEERTRLRRLEQFGRAAGAAAAVIGCVVLAGWAFHVPLLMSVFPTMVAMKANTAVGLVLTGCCMVLLTLGRSGRRDRAARACATFVLLLGAATLLECATGRDLRIDQLLVHEPPGAVGTLSPGRMAADSALGFILLGVALFFLGRPRRLERQAADVLALVAGAISVLALLGYAFGASTLPGLVSMYPMALPTAAALTLLSLGTLCVRAEGGLTAGLTRSTSGGSTARRLVPAGLLGPPLAGALVLAGSKARLYQLSHEFGFLVFASMMSFVAIAAWAARSLDRAERARGRVEEERDRLFTLSRDLMCIADFEGYFHSLNPAWETLGYSVYELTGAPWATFIHPEDVEQTLEAADVIKSGRELLRFENRFRCRDGSYRWLQWNARPVPEERLIYVVARDVTEQRKSHEELVEAKGAAEAANRELEAFSYSVSHDLRAPLRSIAGFARAIEEDCATTLDEAGRQHLARVRAGCQRMSELIEGALALARISRSEVLREPVDLSALALEVVTELRQRDDVRRVDVRIAPCLMVTGDARLIRILLENLLANAWKFTRGRDPARIEVGATAAAFTPDFRETPAHFVRDNGAGFDMEHAGTLFTPFQRLHPQDRFEGSGIGLATAQRIVHRHGGAIWAEAAVNAGATFYFTL